MIASKKIRHKIESCVHYLQNFTDRKWYPLLLGSLALIDYFIIIVPTDGILISSSMLKPKKWFYLAICVALGSTLGALILFYLVKTYGLAWLLEIYPNFNQGETWLLTESFFLKYGWLLVFVIAVSPIVQQPIVILAALAPLSFFHMFITVLTGRLIKSLVLSYIGSHSPKLLSKLWGVKGELDDVGIHIRPEIQRSQPE